MIDGQNNREYHKIIYLSEESCNTLYVLNSTLKPTELKTIYPHISPKAPVSALLHEQLLRRNTCDMYREMIKLYFSDDCSLFDKFTLDDLKALDLIPLIQVVQDYIEPVRILEGCLGKDAKEGLDKLGYVCEGLPVVRNIPTTYARP